MPEKYFKNHKISANCDILFKKIAFEKKNAFFLNCIKIKIVGCLEIQKIAPKIKFIDQVFPSSI